MKFRYVSRKRMLPPPSTASVHPEDELGVDDQEVGVTTKAQLKKTVLGLPETEERTDAGMQTYAVAGKEFVSVTKDGVADFQMSDDDVEKALVRLPTTERLTRNGKPVGLRVPLVDVNGMELHSLVRKSWFSCAPEELAAEQREAAKGQAPDGPDALPAAIGKPATRALLAAGVRTMSDVAARSEEELLALHGMGPKAMRVLQEALKARAG